MHLTKQFTFQSRDSFFYARNKFFLLSFFPVSNFLLDRDFFCVLVRINFL